MAYWLVKSEPAAFSWERLVREGRAMWDGVRNYQARNNLKLMKKGDQVLFYHSNEGLEIVGLAQVAREFYPDPTAKDDPRWVVVDLVPIRPLKRPIGLQAIKKERGLKNMMLVRQSRLSVMPVTEFEFSEILTLTSR